MATLSPIHLDTMSTQMHVQTHTNMLTLNSPASIPAVCFNGWRLNGTTTQSNSASQPLTAMACYRAASQRALAKQVPIASVTKPLHRSYS